MKLGRLPPGAWLVLAACLMTALLALSGGFRPREQRDTQSYRDVDLTSLRAALSHPRTFGYPVWLKVAAWTGAGESAVPPLQWGLYVCALAVLYAGLRAAGFRDVVALSATAPLIASRTVFLFVPQLTGDAPAIALVLASTGCFFAMLAGRWGRTAWVAFSITTLLCYQTRPAYLFLVALWPCLAVALDRWIFRREAGWAEWARRAGKVTACVVLPLLLFCGLRWLLVGHFGLVSFGGYNIIGITGQILDEPLADELPDDLQPLANDIVQRREKLPAYRPPTDFPSMEELYNEVVWRVAVPAAEQRYGGDRVAMNHALTRLSHEVLRRRPAAYARWLLWNAKHAVRQVHFLLLLDPGSLLAALALLAIHLRQLLGGPQPSTIAEPRPTSSRFVERHLLLWTALAFAAAKISLVILVEPAIDRYMTGAAVLLPAALGAYVGIYVVARER